MISRQWRGVARNSDADRYVSHLRAETFPQLSKLRGFIKASILRRTVVDGVEFRIVTTWASSSDDGQVRSNGRALRGARMRAHRLAEQVIGTQLVETARASSYCLRL